MDSVWPDQMIEEANLAVQVLALRKRLGRHAIATLPGRGYCFALQTQELGSGEAAAGPAAAMAPAAPARRPSFPATAQALLGRAAEQQALQALVQAHRVVSVVGSGGIGKTRLALQVALVLQPSFGHGVWWIELAALADPALVAPTVARLLGSAAGAAGDAESAAAAVAAELQAATALLVLDNAEHVLDGVAALVDLLHRQAPRVHCLVTSQVPLRTPAEQQLRLGCLALPANDSLAAARASGAVALFEARARAVSPAFGVDETNCGAVVDICRRLDGLPLAIELAVARLPLLGLQGLRQTLDERLGVLTVNTRGSPVRQQTLRAALDWSHALLSAPQQRVLRRLGVFAGGFTLAAAQQLAADEGIGTELDATGVLDALGALVDKSLVVLDEPALRYRLLESTRLYALERLQQAGERAQMQQRLARVLGRLWTVSQDDHRHWRTPPAPPAALLAELDNARAALDWVAGCSDDTLALSLAAGSSHVFLTAALNAEYLQRVLPLRDRVSDAVPPATAALYLARVALASSRNAHPAGLQAALDAAAIYRRLGELGRLYDALTWAIAIGARHGQGQVLQPLVDEALALEDTAWPAAARSSLQWALHRWLLLQDRVHEALACAQAQARLLAQADTWITHVAWGANVADCEMALGRLARAETLSRDALQALDAQGVDENIVGHVMDALMVALTLQGRSAEAIAIGRRARRLLAREGDDLRLVDTLALNATTDGRFAAAAQLAGHVDAAMALSGEQRWPSGEARRAVLHARLAQALPADELQSHRAIGAALSRERAFLLAFGDAAAR